MNQEWIELDHIGIIIKEELLEAYEVTIDQVCKNTGISKTTLDNVLDGKWVLSSEIALKLGRYFGIDPKYLLNIQTELEVRRTEQELIGILDTIRPLQMA